MRLPILAGRLRGRWWESGSPGKLFRVIGGSYEPEQTREFERALRPGDTVLDVGAHAGYYSLLSSLLVGDSGAVWAFEPNPRNFRSLRANLELNGCRNARAVQLAVSDRTGEACFEAGSGSGTGHLSAGGSLPVRTVSLDEFCAERGIRPAAVKIDVEGAELDVLAGAKRVLGESRPVVFLSTHGAGLHDSALRWLAEAGYAARAVDGGDVAAATEVVAVARPG